LLDAHRANTEKEKFALMDLARMWTQAAFEREGLYDDKSRQLAARQL
jgi:hypothetical protein